MKYFIDTEFIEGFHKPLFGKRRHFIDLISIGIVAEDGRCYYAISNEFNPKDADQWVKDNVISKLPYQYINLSDPSVSPNSKAKSLLWRSNAQIVSDIMQFVQWDANIEFYGYYSDYDWVVFCSLFGRMIDLPKGFPMFCLDLKQMMHDKGLTAEWKKSVCPDPEGEHDALVDAKWNYELYKAITAAP